MKKTNLTEQLQKIEENLKCKEEINKQIDALKKERTKYTRRKNYYEKKFVIEFSKEILSLALEQNIITKEHHGYTSGFFCNNNELFIDIQGRQLKTKYVRLCLNDFNEELFKKHLYKLEKLSEGQFYEDYRIIQKDESEIYFDGV